MTADEATMGADSATKASRPNTDIFDCFMVLPE
jgi:hypothetical protein